METNEIRSQQRASWNKFSQGWKKWDDLTMRFLQKPGEVMFESIPWKETFDVLDIACGTGEPGLTAAAIVKRGNVTGTDLAEDMVAIAAQNAMTRGIKNYRAQVCSADDLPFAKNSFDVVLCRMGFMFFPDILVSTREIHRVLKSGGFVTASVFSAPQRNEWATTILNIIKQYVDMPLPGPDTPGLFRCAGERFLKNYFDKAGFKDYNEKEVPFTLEVDSEETYWSWHTEVAAPVTSALSKVDETTRQKIKREVMDAVSKYKIGGTIVVPALATVVTARK